jgi:hypothetical protein
MNGENKKTTPLWENEWFWAWVWVWVVVRGENVIFHITIIGNDKKQQCSDMMRYGYLAMDI